MAEKMLPGERPVPHITVKIEYDGKMVSQQGAHFIDAVAFLCDVERAIRYGKNLPKGQTTDDSTQQAIQHNRQLLFGPHDKPIDV